MAGNGVAHEKADRRLPGWVGPCVRALGALGSFGAALVVVGDWARTWPPEGVVAVVTALCFVLALGALARARLCSLMLAEATRGARAKQVRALLARRRRQRLLAGAWTILGGALVALPYPALQFWSVVLLGAASSWMRVVAPDERPT